MTVVEKEEEEEWEGARAYGEVDGGTWWRWSPLKLSSPSFSLFLVRAARGERDRFGRFSGDWLEKKGCLMLCRTSGP